MKSGDRRRLCVSDTKMGARCLSRVTEADVRGSRKGSEELEILCSMQHRAIVTLFDWSAEIEHPWYISELGDPFDKCGPVGEKTLSKTQRHWLNRLFSYFVNYHPRYRLAMATA